MILPEDMLRRNVHSKTEFYRKYLKIQICLQIKFEQSLKFLEKNNLWITFLVYNVY